MPDAPPTMKVTNRLTRLFESKHSRLLSVYFTAGYPTLESVIPTIQGLSEAGVDFIEIGFPYSDPLADGPVIQNSSTQAIRNGMNLPFLFDQLRSLRPLTVVPALLMGYVNPVMQYGVEAFCKSCAEVGIDGLILPDLPILEYERLYQPIFEAYGLSAIFLVTPQSAPERIRTIDSLSQGFIYLLSSSSTTGQTLAVGEETNAYLHRIQGMNLTNPLMVGFGISTPAAFASVCDYAAGAIVGTAFIRAQENQVPIAEFIGKLKGTH